MRARLAAATVVLAVAAAVVGDHHRRAAAVPPGDPDRRHDRRGDAQDGRGGDQAGPHVLACSS